MFSATLSELLHLIDDTDGHAPLDDAIARLDLDTDTAGLVRQLAFRCRSEARNRQLVDILYETATDLAAIGDTDAVLLAIVQRTRAVTGADMAYVSLNDHTLGETYIRQCDGVRTPEYASIRMPLGTGVLGKAATGLAVVATSDYVDDPTIVHLDDIDAIVRREGVRSILGVPMNVQGRIQGALLIADRRRIDYPPETLAVVDAIARQAAVAIDYSARLTHLTGALAELGARQDARQARLGAMQRLLDLDRSMIEAVAARDQGAILRLLASVYEAEAEFLPQGDEPGDPLLRAAIVSAASSGLPFPVPTSSGTVTICAARVGATHLGTALVHADVDARERDLLEHAALHLGLCTLIDGIEATAEQRSQYELLDDLTSDRAVPGAALSARLRQQGLDPRRPLTVLAVGTAGRPAEALPLIRGALQAPALVAEHGEHLCVISQPDEGAAARVQAGLAAVGDTQVGSARAGSLGEISPAHRRAGAALASLRLLGGRTLDGDTVGALGALLEAEFSGALPHGVRAPARPLVDYDSAHGTDLVRTAWAFLEYGPQSRPVAEALFIHPNTLRQRTQRIAELLGAAWATGVGRLDLHLALRALMIERGR